MTDVNLDEILHSLIEDYRTNSDVCLYDFLATEVPSPGMTYRDCLRIYCLAMHLVEGDEFYRLVENEKENLVTGERMPVER